MVKQSSNTPIPEQAAIVAQVERLLGLVGQLESEAAGQRVQAEGLLQAALREAMNGNEEG